MFFNQILLQLPILFIANSLAPLAMYVFAGDFHCEMGEPAIGCRVMPMLYAGSNVNNVARMELRGVIALLLIISAAGNANKYLPAALICLMNVPVVTAAWLKRNVENTNLRGRERRKIALTDEVFCKSVIRCAYSGHHRVLMSLLDIASISIGPYTSFAMRNAAHALGQPA